MKRFVLAGVFLGSVALAQTPPRDPTVPSDKVQKALAPPVTMTAPGAVPLPAIALKGRVMMKGKPAVALLDIGGAAYTVSPGQVLETAGRKLKVSAVNATTVKIEIEGTTDAIVLN